MEAYLHEHPAHPAGAIKDIRVELTRASRCLLDFYYIVQGDIEDLVIPAPALERRRDRLWETTCFEAFLRPVGSSTYRELNFSPSGEWAAYEFSAYRMGMTLAPLPAPPVISTFLQTEYQLEVHVTISLDLPADDYQLGLSAVIAERRAKSFWAISHPSAAPDFHHDCCFALKLPPPSAP
jgi:hypothetical protein